MLTILSPSKTLDFDNSQRIRKSSRPRFLDESAILVDQLRGFNATRLARLMQVNPKLASLNVERFKDWKTPFTPSNARQAIFAFKGDVYGGLDAASMNNDDLDFAQAHLRILSGLYGLLRPLDLIQPYRLEMGTELKTPRGRNLYQFWGDRLTTALNRDLRISRNGLLVNLASSEYYDVLQQGELKARVITPEFREKKNGVYRFFSFYGKKARGLMAGFIIRNRLTDPDDIRRFDLEGYRYNPKLSAGDNWVFTRG